MTDRTPLTEIERSIFEKLARASFPPATASKRLVRDFANGYVQNLSERGREFLAFVAHRFRRQWQPTDEEAAWVRKHLSQRSEQVPREHQMPPRAEFPDAHRWISGGVVHSGQTSEHSRDSKGKSGTSAPRKSRAICAPAQLELF